MIVYVTFETEFSAYGGLGAVMKLLPHERGADTCVVLSPLFPKLVDLAKVAKAKGVRSVASLFTFHVVVRGRAYPVEVIEVAQTAGLRLFFLASNEFFQARDNPYVNPGDRERPLDPYRNPVNTDALTEDSLFFSTAVPIALAELCKEGRIEDRNLVLHLQDWETASVAMAVRRTPIAPAISSVRCALTIHNPYDKPLHAQNSQRVCDFAAHLGIELNRSVLEQVIPVLDAPVSTVSKHFAHEMRNEVLYTQVFCPHLQKVFKSRGLVGIDNGVFGASEFPFSRAALDAASAGDLSVLRAEKMGRRSALPAVLADCVAKPATSGGAQAWGGPLDLADPAVPVFMFLGRDDPRQKGFDVMVEAIRSLPRGSARYVFAVMPGDEGFLGLEFLKRFAEERPDEVCVFPYRVDRTAFTALQRGCSFLVMGSLYEPFGAATEAYFAGMPVVARATGGLVQQVVPHEQCMWDEAILSLYGRQLVRAYHPAPAPPTGIVFREQVSFSEEVEGWREIVDCGYWDLNPKGDRIEERRGILLFRRMAASAAVALRLAISVYADAKQYPAMIVNGWNMLPKFTWRRAVVSYEKHLYSAAP